jgi:hypothetical protein
VLIFRFLTLFVQVPIGAACYVWWRATEGRKTGTLQPSGAPGGTT